MQLGHALVLWCGVVWCGVVWCGVVVWSVKVCCVALIVFVFPPHGRNSPVSLASWCRWEDEIKLLTPCAYQTDTSNQLFDFESGVWAETPRLLTLARAPHSNTIGP